MGRTKSRHSSHKDDNKDTDDNQHKHPIGNQYSASRPATGQAMRRHEREDIQNNAIYANTQKDQVREQHYDQYRRIENRCRG